MHLNCNISHAHFDLCDRKHHNSYCIVADRKSNHDHSLSHFDHNYCDEHNGHRNVK